jgi:hypothetical protein
MRCEHCRPSHVYACAMCGKKAHGEPIGVGWTKPARWAWHPVEGAVCHVCAAREKR